MDPMDNGWHKEGIWKNQYAVNAIYTVRSSSEVFLTFAAVLVAPDVCIYIYI